MKFLVILLLGTVFCDQAADYVKPEDLAKFNITLSEKLYGGYLSANSNGSAQFFYLFLLTDPTLPVTLWLNGGPGCSSLQGFFNEMGPINFFRGTSNMKPNPFAWSKISNILYLESPINVGFSYGPVQPQNDTTTAAYNLQALVSFFLKFNQFQGSEFYMTGESYAGIYIPTLAKAILEYNQQGSKYFSINLKGVMIGNGCTHPTECGPTTDHYEQHVYRFWGGHNLISPETAKKANENVDRCYTDTPDDFCKQLVHQINNEFDGDHKVDHYNVYNNCTFESINDTQRLYKGYKHTFNKRLGEELDPCGDDLGLYTLMRNKTFLETIHVNTSIVDKWEVCSNETQNFTYTVQDEASYYIYPIMIKAGLRVWKFSGDIDSVVPITGTLYWIDILQKQFNLPTLVEWRPWFIAGEYDDQRQVGGNFWKLKGLTFVSVKDAGHMVPTDQKPAAFALFQAFLNDEELPAK